MKGLTDFKRGIVETAEGASLLGIAIVLRENSPGAEWYSVKDPTGQERDLRPLFPFAPFLFMADLILKAYKDEPISEEFLKEGTEAVIGVSARSGALGNLMRTGYARVLNEDDPYSAKKFGKDVGGLFGYILGGFATPLRPIQDLAGTIGRNKNLERSMQSNAFGVDIEVEWPRMQGFIDQAAKDIFRGTPFEEGFEASVPGTDISIEVPGAFKDTPEAISPTGLETPSAPAAPIEKQLTGATVMREKTPVGDELAKLGIPEWKLVPYTEVKEYNFLFKELLGEFSTLIVEPYINSSEYLNMSPREQKRNLNNFYRGKDLSNLNKRLRRGLTKYGQKTPVNVRALVKSEIEARYPLLDRLAKFKKGISSADLSKALEKFKTTPEFLDIKRRLPSRIGKTSNSISLNYIDEKNNKEEAQALDELLAGVQAIVKPARSLTDNQLLNVRKLSLGSRKNNDQLKSMNKAKGGYVTQMNALGL